MKKILILLVLLLTAGLLAGAVVHALFQIHHRQAFHGALAPFRSLRSHKD